MFIKMKRHELWEMEYRDKPYLKHTSNKDLYTRVNDIIKNSWILTKEGKIAYRPILSEGWYWISRWTHILEEFRTRGDGIPMGLQQGAMPIPTYPKTPSAVTALKGRNFNNKGYLFKYGSKKHLKKMYEKGDLRISPVTKYNDSSLNSAINDDEQMLSTFLNPNNTQINHISKNGTTNRIKPIGNIEVTHQADTDYYAYCMADVYDYRLFDDFEYDACIIIKDVDKFIGSIKNTVAEFIEGCKFIKNKVKYIDPLNPPYIKSIDIYFCKHFRYAYQKEIRIILLPDKQVKNLKDLYINIGCMSEYAEYIELK